MQISFANNVLSLSSGLTNFVAELTGDMVNDVDGVVGGGFVRVGDADYPVDLAAANTFGYVQLGSLGGASGSRRLVPFYFNDARVNDGNLASGFLDVEGYASFGSASLQIHRLIFDDASTTAPTGVTSASPAFPAWSAVPEPSSLGLLALGAGGLLARRRRAA